MTARPRTTAAVVRAAAVAVVAASAGALLAGCSSSSTTDAAGPSSAPPAATSSGATAATSQAAVPASGTPSSGATATAAADPTASAPAGPTPTPGTATTCRKVSPLTDVQSEAARRNPVYAAVFGGKVATLRTALRGATKAQVNDTGAAPPLVEAVANRCPAMVRLLLDAGADPNAFWTDGEVRSPLALQLAAQADDVDTVRLLLARKAKVDGWGDDGVTAAVAAASAGSVRALKALLAAGASPTARVPDPDYSLTPLEAAVRAPSPAAARLLLGKVRKPPASLVWPAVESGSLPMLKFVLAAGVSPTPPVAPSGPFSFIDSTDPAAYAQQRGRPEMAAVLRG